MAASYRLLSARELDAGLADAWRSIQSRSAEFASPFFCPEFTRLVAEVRDDVYVVVIENGGRPAGFFPHQRTRWGEGKPVGGPLSDYHGVIAPPQAEWELAPLLRAARLSLWSFDHLAGHAHKFAPYATGRASSPRIDLGAGYEAYVRGRREAGSEQIAQAARKERKLAREVGEMSFALHEADGAALETLIAWKRDQYARTQVLDALSAQWSAGLLRRISTAQAADFAGVCSVLRAGERIVAIHMGMRSRSVLHYWFPAYDPQLGRFSAGIILLLRMAQALAGTPVGVIDLGKGDMRYKSSLMTDAVDLLEGCVETPSLLASARRLQRAAETRAARGGIAAALRLPLRVMRRLERMRRFR